MSNQNYYSISNPQLYPTDGGEFPGSAVTSVQVHVQGHVGAIHLHIVHEVAVLGGAGEDRTGHDGHSSLVVPGRGSVVVTPGYVTQLPPESWVRGVTPRPLTARRVPARVVVTKTWGEGGVEYGKGFGSIEGKRTLGVVGLCLEVTYRCRGMTRESPRVSRGTG